MDLTTAAFLWSATPASFLAPLGFVVIAVLVGYAVGRHCR
jgi:hypothetical protein